MSSMSRSRSATRRRSTACGRTTRARRRTSDCSRTSASAWFGVTPAADPMILLIRHAMVDACGRFLAGRTPGIHLNEEGVRQAAALRESLHDLPIAAIYCSPLERARETAAALAGDRIGITTAEELNEVDFGAWTGLTFAELDRRDDWLAFNRARSTSAI